MIEQKKKLTKKDYEIIKSLLKYVVEVYDEFEKVYQTDEFEQIKKELAESEEVRIIPSNSISVSKLARCEFLAYYKRLQHLKISETYTVSDTHNFRKQSSYQDRGVWFDRFLKYKLSQSEFAEMLEFDYEVKLKLNNVLLYSRIDIVIKLYDDKLIGLEIKSNNIYDTDELVLNFYKYFFDYVIVFSPELYKKLVNREKIAKRVRVDIAFDVDEDNNVYVKLHSKDEQFEAYFEYFDDYTRRVNDADSTVFLNLNFCKYCELARQNKCQALALYNLLDNTEKKQFELMNKKNKLKFKYFINKKARNELILSLL